MSIDPTLLDDLEWRGLIAHSTDLDALREALGEGSVRFYVGFDPTAPSLHMGHLVQILTARRLQQAGHTPYALVGGATGMIGDPKESRRAHPQLPRHRQGLGRARPAPDRAVPRLRGPQRRDHGQQLRLDRQPVDIDFLRDIGKHFPVNRMLARDVVSRRLEHGISYTEFSYVLLQSMDFLNLYRDHGVTLQFGGSDQWGNLTGGVELIRRADGGRAHAFATPLLTKSDGTKYGKTEGGALWLDPEMLSPYAFHQFWLNVEDEKVGELLRVFTFLSREEIEALEEQTRGEAVPARRPEGARRRGDHAGPRRRRRPSRPRPPRRRCSAGETCAQLSAATLAAALREAGAVAARRGELPAIVDLLVESGLAKSKGEARRTVGEGGAYLNNERVEDPELVPAEQRPGRRLLAGAAPRQEEASPASRCVGR